MKFGCCVDVEKYDELAETGYDFIELAGHALYNMTGEEFNAACKKVKEGSIECRGLNSFLAPHIVVVGFNVDDKAVDEYIDKVTYRGHTIGAGTIGFGSPLSRTVPEGMCREKAQEQIITFIQRVLDRIRDYNIKLLLEPLNKQETNFINNVGEALGIIKKVNCDRFGLLLDLYHICVEKEDIGVINSDTVKCLGHVHIAEEKGRRYLLPENYSLYKKLISRLKYAGYNETISIEGSFQCFRHEAIQALHILRQIDKET